MNHISRPARLLLLTLFLPAAAPAASVTIDAALNGIGDASGVDLPQGCLIRVGTFTLPPASLVSNQNRVAVLESNFVAYGTATVGPTYDVPGHFNTVLLADTAALGLENAPIYLWIFNSTNAAAATQHGIYTSTNGAWVFPVESDSPNTTTLDLNQVPTNAVTVGRFGTGTSDATGEPLYNLAVLPLATWTLDQFGTNRFTPAIAGPSADPDQDGLVNLLEYGLGSSPLTPTPGAPLQLGVTNGTAYLTFGRNTNATDATWTVEASTNLLSWSTFTNVTTAQPSPGAATVTVQDNTAAPVRFHRLRVSAP